MTKWMSVALLFGIQSGMAPALARQQGACEPAWLPTFVGNGVDNVVHSLQVLDDGNGPALYVGGHFATAGGIQVDGLAKWDGLAGTGNWTGFGGFVDTVLDMIYFDDGSGAGPMLYACGSFVSAGGVAILHIAKWDGSSWSALGSGVIGNSLMYSVRSMVVFDDGRGPALFVGGLFANAGGHPNADFVARWDGTAWSALGNGTGGAVNALAVFDDGTGPALYAAGEFWPPQGPGSAIAKWDGRKWSPLGTGLNNSAFSLAVFDDDGQAALYAGGRFTMAGGVPANRIAKWVASPNGGYWSNFGTGLYVGCDAYSCMNNCGGQAPAGCWCDEFCCSVHDCCNDKVDACGGCYPQYLTAQQCAVEALAVHDDGSGAGPMLYAAGFFPPINGSVVPHLARWNGVEWQGLAPNARGGTLPANVNALASYQGKNNERSLFVGGHFTNFPTGDAFLAHWQGCSQPICIAPDVNCDGAVNVADLLAVINAWGPCPAPPILCSADVNDDGAVNVADLLMVINNWS